MLQNQNRIRRPNRRDVSPPPRRLNRRAQAGASLIEIMVVLVILLIGVFLAIRIFPAGFGVLRSNDNRTRSVRLAEQLLGDAQNNAAALPLGVLFDAPIGNTTALGTVVNQDPDDLSAYTGLSGGATSPYYTDVNKYRFIEGEPVKIPVATATIGSSGIPGSMYLLRFGPIYMDPTVGDPTTAPTATNQGTYTSYLNVVSAPLVGYNVLSNNPTITTSMTGTGATPAAQSTAPPLGADGITNVSGDLQGQTSYLIDYGSATNPALIMFAQGLNLKTFSVTYSYTTTNGSGAQIVQSVTVPLTLTVNQGSATSTAVPVAGLPVWQALPPPTGTGVAMNVVPGSVSVRRAFDRVANTAGTGPTWDPTNPYQYCLGSANVPSSFANIGQIYFNPSGANYSVPTPTGQQAFMAYVDYNVLDWHIIRDDLQVPSVSPGTLGLIPVKTTLNLIKRIGDVNTDKTIYDGIYNDQTAATPPDPDVAVYNLATGALLLNTYDGGTTNGNVIHGVAQPTPTIAPTCPDFYIDTDPHQGTYATGTVYINPLKVPAGTQLRILYKADGDWAVALQKAYAQYTPEPSANTPGAVATRPAMDTMTGDATYGFGNHSTFGIDNSTAGSARIYFPRCDLNKSVTVVLQYPDSTSTAGQTTYVRIPATQFTIDNADGNYAYIDLLSTAGANTGALSTTNYNAILNLNKSNASPTWNVVGPILGVSVKARVIYKDNNNTNNNWRIQDIDTYLTPAS